jgi:glycine cleavage system transcriptional repressor
MRKQFFLLNAFGRDRPGMVAGLTQVLFDLGGNIEDASMTRLGGEFAMMFVTALPADITLSNLQKKLSVLEKKVGLQLSAKPITPQLARGTQRAEPRYLISVYGTDRPGIVFQVTQALARRKVSVTDLHTKAITQDGKSIYVMLLEIQAPATLDVDELREELDRLRTNLHVEINLQDIEAVPL